MNKKQKSYPFLKIKVRRIAIEKWVKVAYFYLHVYLQYHVQMYRWPIEHIPIDNQHHFNQFVNIDFASKTDLSKIGGHS
jgi:hypothetical protein